MLSCGLHFTMSCYCLCPCPCPDYPYNYCSLYSLLTSFKTYKQHLSSLLTEALTKALTKALTEALTEAPQLVNDLLRPTCLVLENSHK